jgi:YVTN family beta-propeller protein
MEKKAYFANTYNNNIPVIDTAKNKSTATVPIDYPKGIAVNPAGTKVYVMNEQNVSVINTTTNTMIGTVPIGHTLSDFAITPDETKVYVVDHDADSVFVIDTATNNVTEIPVGE